MSKEAEEQWVVVVLRPAEGEVSVFGIYDEGGARFVAEGAAASFAKAGGSDAQYLAAPIQNPDVDPTI